jgi:beta-phosphoglucomutase
MSHDHLTIAPRAALWDVDGTLLDSADYHYAAWREALEPYGIALTRERFAATFGQRNAEILINYFGQDAPAEQLAQIDTDKEVRYRELMRVGGVEPLPGVRRWLALLQANGWRQAVASSAPAENVRTILAALDIAHFFDAIVTAEDVERGKPDPQVFLTGAAKLDVPPARCIVVEDVPAGIEGAHRAGMRAIGVLSSHRALQADIVVRTLDELADDAFERLLERPRA